MKKKLFLLFTFLITFVIFSNSVMAAQELTCLYEQMSEEEDYLGHMYQKKIIQDSNGNITYYYLSQEGGLYGTYYWKVNDNAKVDFKNTSSYDEEKKVLTKCPECVSWKNNLNDPDNDKFTFKDKSSNNKCSSKYAELKEEKHEIEDTPSCKKIDTPTQNDINNTIWLAKCAYGNGEYSATIYLNNDSFLLESKSDSDNIFSCITHSELLTAYERRQEFCPKSIYFLKNSNELSFYLENSSASSVKSMTLQEGTYYDENGNIRKSKTDITIDTNVPSDCRELFGTDLINEINKVMNVIRIAVPILLLVLGITDFFRATFANGEEDIKKSRDRFIKRIIAAIVVFIVPIFVNLVLKLANIVWDDINVETCIDADK